MLFDVIKSDLKNAMRDKNVLLFETLRGLKKDIIRNIHGTQNSFIDSIILGVILKRLKKLSEDFLYYNSNSDYDKAERKRREMEIIESYLPEQFSDKELNLVIQSKIREIGATGPRDMSRVMAEVMKHVKGRTNGKTVNSLVRDILAG
jgi:hypothetical protein